MTHQYKGHCDKSMIKYIEDNIQEKGCESLNTHFNTELQSIQSDLKHYIMLYKYTNKKY